MIENNIDLSPVTLEAEITKTNLITICNMISLAFGVIDGVVGNENASNMIGDKMISQEVIGVVLQNAINKKIMNGV